MEQEKLVEKKEKEPSLEELAEEIYGNIESKKIKSLITSARKEWTNTKKQSITKDSLRDHEIKLLNEDPTLAKWSIQRQILKEKIIKRIDELVSRDRELPYQVTKEKGILISLYDYDLEILRKCCGKNKLDLEEDLYNCQAFVRTIKPSMTLLKLPIILDVLKAAFKKQGEN